MALFDTLPKTDALASLINANAVASQSQTASANRFSESIRNFINNISRTADLNRELEAQQKIAAERNQSQQINQLLNSIFAGARQRTGIKSQEKLAAERIQVQRELARKANEAARNRALIGQGIDPNFVPNNEQTVRPASPSTQPTQPIPDPFTTPVPNRRSTQLQIPSLGTTNNEPIKWSYSTR